jgi:alpha-galactosidase
MKQSAQISAAGIDFQFSLETHRQAQCRIETQVTPIAEMPDTYLLRLSVEAHDQQPFVLRDLCIEWTVPIVDMHGLYFCGNPMSELSYLPFWQVHKQTCANRGIPFVALIHRSGENRMAVGLVDQITETSITAELSEITRSYHFRLQKPANKDSTGQMIHVRDCWEEVLVVSTAAQEWQCVLSDYVLLSDRITQPVKMPVPDHAFDPVFCTWTAIHHDISHEWIVRNARLAAELGFRTWITDDGWFIEQGQFADYSKVGDWTPAAAKFPDFREHVHSVQELGFRYVLWVAPFMVGYDSEAAQQYAHLLTTGQERNHFHNLSPWHDETRQIVATLLERLVRDYDLDGLKIDFLDSISIHSLRKDGAREDTLGSSIYDLLQTVTEHLMTINPELLIEFRNSYTNLASRSYANIYRSSDVPLNPALNRWQAVMLRLLTPDRAVHLDPALWHAEDSDTNVAVHLINLMVGVPMVSIQLDQYPQSHIDLIRCWIGFYNTHRDTLIHGTFKPVLRQGYIPLVRFVGEQETIIAVYDDVPVALEANGKSLWLLNGSTQAQIHLADTSLNGEHQLIFRDKFGSITSEETAPFPAQHLNVEIGGSVEIKQVVK